MKLVLSQDEKSFSFSLQNLRARQFFTNILNSLTMEEKYFKSRSQFTSFLLKIIKLSIAC